MYSRSSTSPESRTLMRAHRPAATLATAAIIATSFAACDDTIAYASGCTQHIAVGGNTDTHSRNVPGAPRTSIRVTYPADVFNRASRPIAERQIRDVAERAWTRGCHITIWAYSLGASAASTVTDSWIRHGARGSWNATFYGSPRMPRHHGNLIGIEAARLPNIGYTYRGASLRSPRIRNICNVRDAICSMPAPWTRNVGQSADHIVGYFGTQHRYR